MINSLPSSQLQDALFELEELMERCQIKFFLTGDLGRQIFDTPDAELHLDKLTVSVLKEDFTQFSESTLKMLRPDAVIKKKKITFDCSDVPVEITLIQGDYTFFHYPDSVFYFVSQFLIPNPFNTYWTERHNIL